MGAWTSKLDVPGIITNGSIHAAGEVAFNGICNAIDKRGFFEGWQYSAMFGFIDGAYGGYTAANENGENFWWGGTVREGKSPWSLNPNGPVVVRFKNVKDMGANFPNGCAIEVVEEIDAALHGTIVKSPEEYMRELNYSPEKGVFPPLNEGVIRNTFPNADVSSYHPKVVFDQQIIKNAAAKKGVVTIKWVGRTNDQIGHVDNIRKVKFYRNSDKSRFFVRNPSYNSFKSTYHSNPIGIPYKVYITIPH